MDNITAQTVKPEILAAAKWWADQLRQGIPAHDNGDAFQSVFARFAASKVNPSLTDDQIGLFEVKLAEILSGAFGFSGDSWRPDQPMWGGARRVISTDYSPDEILSEALTAAGIRDTGLLLPIKTIMWIDPNCVRVSRGYGANSGLIYGSERND